MNNNSKYQLGMQALKHYHGGHVGEKMVTELEAISPEMAKMTIEWAFAEVVSRNGITPQLRELVTIAACISNGTLTPQLRAHYHSALKLGVTKQEIIEVILQMVFYAGLASSSNALRLLQEVYIEHQQGE